MSKPLLLIFSCFLLWNCASYTDTTRDVRNAMYQSEYPLALERLDKSGLAKDKKSSALYHMEKGTLLFLNNQYASATKEWDQSLKKIEELYTVSISSQAASLTLNESFADYEGEAHEKLLLPIYSSLAYLKDNAPEKATVEIRRLYEISNELKDSEDAQVTKNAIDRNFLSRALGGFVYEMRDQWDSAIVEYRKALDDEEIDTSLFDETNSVTFAKALARLAEWKNRTDVLTRLKKKFPGLSWEKQAAFSKHGELLIVAEIGKAPIKIPQDFVVPFGGNVLRISFPVFKEQSYSTYPVRVKIDGKDVGETNTALNVGDLAKKSLEARRGKALLRMAARLVAKDQAARAVGRQLGPLAQIAASVTGAVLETADTRSWTLLPDRIQILRASIPANKNVTIDMESSYKKPSQVTLNLKPGEKRVVHVRSFL